MDKKFWQINKKDEWFTPKYAVEPIVNYLREGLTIWCPFDTQESEYVKVLKDKGFKVIYSHISEGKDFYDYVPTEHFDCIVSNPPFSQGDEIFKRLFELKKPFAVLFNMNGVFDSKTRFNLFKNNGIEMLILSRRVKFIDSEDIKKYSQPPFLSIYVCHDILPTKIEYAEINKD